MYILTVRQGDTVSEISRQYGVSVNKIISDNGLDENGTLVTGQSLVIRVPIETYMSNSGDTAEAVAEKFNITPLKLYRNNIFLGGRNEIPPNSEIVIEYESSPNLSKFVGGYAYDFISQRLLDTVLPYMTYLMPFTYGFNTSGELIMLNDEFLLDSANRYGVMPLMHLSTLTEYGNFSNELANSVLNNESALQALIENVLINVREKGYFGVDVDFEFLFAEDKQRYVEFINRLTLTMNQNGYITVVALPPKTSDTQTGLLYSGVDYAGLGEAANYTMLMTYEWGYRFGPPLAIAPVPSVRRVVEYALSRIPADKIILGVPNYGYDWTLPFVRGESDAPSLSTREALDIAKRYGAEILFDDNSQAPYFYYTDDVGREHVVWFEDARSYEAKVRLIEEYNLAGAFIWDLMRENPQGFVTLNGLIDIQTK